MFEGAGKSPIPLYQGGYKQSLAGNSLPKLCLRSGALLIYPGVVVGQSKRVVSTGEFVLYPALDGVGQDADVVGVELRIGFVDDAQCQVVAVAACPVGGLVEHVFEAAFGFCKYGAQIGVLAPFHDDIAAGLVLHRFLPVEVQA